MPEFASVEQIRRHFPALARTHNGHPVAYFDGPGGTQVPRRVVAAMTEYLLQHNANTDWAFPTSQETDQALFEARGALADWVGGSADEIVFGANMTTLTLHLGRALGGCGGRDRARPPRELRHLACAGKRARPGGTHRQDATRGWPPRPGRRCA